MEVLNMTECSIKGICVCTLYRDKSFLNIVNTFLEV